MRIIVVREAQEVRHMEGKGSDASVDKKLKNDYSVLFVNLLDLYHL